MICIKQKSAAWAVELGGFGVDDAADKVENSCVRQYTKGWLRKKSHGGSSFLLKRH